MTLTDNGTTFDLLRKIHVRKMNRTLRTLILFLVAGYTSLSAQESGKWTLQDCINYAVENNIGLQRQMLQTGLAEADLLKAGWICCHP